MNSLGAIVIEGHIQGLSNVRALGEMDIPVYILDVVDCVAHYSKYCQKFFKCPAYLSDEFADFLVHLAKKEDIDGWILFPSNDHALFTISKHKKKLETHYRFTAPESEKLIQIYDKTRLLELAKQCKIPIPTTYYFSKQEIMFDEIEYPVITKGKIGLSFYKSVGKKAFLSNSKDELINNLANISNRLDINQTFTQEIIPFNGTNYTVSFTAFVLNGNIKAYWIGEKIREHPIQFGTATFCQSVTYPKILESSTLLLKKLNYNGICEIEYILDPRDNKYKLIEINARTWLWIGLAKACGIDFVKMQFKYLCGEKEINYPLTYQKNIKWINLITDTPYSIISIFKRKMTLFQYLKSFKGNLIFAVFSFDDILPALLFPFIVIFNSGKRKRK